MQVMNITKPSTMIIFRTASLIGEPKKPWIRCTLKFQLTSTIVGLVSLVTEIKIMTWEEYIL